MPLNSPCLRALARSLVLPLVLPLTLAVAGAAHAALPAANAPAIGDALDRAAVAVRSPERAVLLSAALAGKRLVAVGERGIVALSDDGGQHWRQALTPTSVTLTAVRFADAKFGWAIGHGGVVLASEDGGEHWVRQLDGRQAAQIVLETARAAGQPKAVQDAERMVAEGPDKPLLDLRLQGQQRLLVVGAYGLVLASEDGGKRWASWSARLPNPKALHLYVVRQRAQTVLLAGEQGLVMLSLDGGRNFRRIETPYQGSFFTAELLGEQEIVLAGLRGTALRSIDGGATWAVLATPMPVSITATALTDDGQLLAANQAGFVLTLKGDRLIPMHAVPLPPLNGLLARPGASPLALSVMGAMPLPTEQGNPK